jgi:hypothetical protein
VALTARIVLKQQPTLGCHLTGSSDCRCAALGRDPTALYRRATNKADLLDGVAETVLGVARHRLTGAMSDLRFPATKPSYWGRDAT